MSKSSIFVLYIFTMLVAEYGFNFMFKAQIESTKYFLNVRL